MDWFTPVSRTIVIKVTSFDPGAYIVPLEMNGVYSSMALSGLLETSNLSVGRSD